MGKKKKKRSIPAETYRIFVDYENAPDCLPLAEGYNFEEMWIFVGRQQRKIPLELVQRTQQLGRAVNWVSPGAVGKNALDFILAMHVGMHHVRAEDGVAFAIFSADKGYDPLIGELAREGRKVVRVNPERALPSRRSTRKKAAKKAQAATRAPKKVKGITVADLVDRVAERLARTGPARLPTRKTALLKHVESQLPATEKDRAESVVHALQRRKVLTVDARTGAVRYRSS